MLLIYEVCFRYARYAKLRMRRNFFIVNVYVILLIRFQGNNFERPKRKYGKGKYGKKIKVNVNNNASEIAFFIVININCFRVRRTRESS